METFAASKSGIGLIIFLKIIGSFTAVKKIWKPIACGRSQAIAAGITLVDMAVWEPDLKGEKTTPSLNGYNSLT